ncbi:hypothetical protein HanIR_Chr02g0080361 [Helianthus annuus]|nr:hypothetical protein HanIR_Chr02g0080361 [Helianthus annuus]
MKKKYIFSHFLFSLFGFYPMAQLSNNNFDVYLGWHFHVENKVIQPCKLIFEIIT